MRDIHLQPTAALLRGLVFVYCMFNFSSFLRAVLLCVCSIVVLGGVMETGQLRFKVVLRLTQRKALLDTLI